MVIDVKTTPFYNMPPGHNGGGRRRRNARAASHGYSRGRVEASPGHDSIGPVARGGPEAVRHDAYVHSGDTGGGAV